MSEAYLDPDENCANARLMAAAPDLLSALRNLTAELSRYAIVMDTIDLSVYEAALAAEAKATGTDL